MRINLKAKEEDGAEESARVTSSGICTYETLRFIGLLGCFFFLGSLFRLSLLAVYR